MTHRFRSLPHGVGATVPNTEADLLAVIPELLTEVASGDPVWSRFHPAAYPADPVADREFRRLIERDAEAARSVDRATFTESLERARIGTVLTTEEGDAWLRVLNETRILLAIRLGIEMGDDGSQAADPSLEGFYDYLTWLQGQLVAAASGDLP